LESLAGIFMSSFAVAFSGAVMPGPVLTVTISESARRGFRTGPLIVLGHGILEIALLVLIAFGLSELISRPFFIGMVGVSGAVILFWMAVGMFRSLGGIGPLETPAGGRSRHPVVSGILTSISNPYWFIWWATIGMGYVLISVRFGLPGLIVFFTGHILADLAWYSLVSWLISRGKGFLSVRIYRGLIGICAAVLALFGIYFGAYGLKQFFPV